jgi:hypothetical protein
VARDTLAGTAAHTTTMRPASVAILITMMTTAACAAGTRGTTRGISRRILLGDEIRASSAATAYDAVAALRPEWLTRRGRVSVRSAGELVVYVDGMRQGGVTSLRSIRATDVFQMEYLDGPSATVRFGTGHGGGVILVRIG